MVEDSEPESQTSSLLSVQSYLSSQFHQDVSAMYAQGQLYSILLLAQENTQKVFESHTHLIISQTLFNLGRVGAGLRELSLAIENEPDPPSRELLIEHLISFFAQLGMAHECTAGFAEIIAMAKFDARLSPGDEEIQTKVLKYQKKLDRVQELTKNCLSANPLKALEKLPLHEQAEKYLGCNGVFDEYSLGKMCQTVYLDVELAKSLVSQWKNSKLSVLKDPLLVLYNTFTYWPPLYLYDKIVENEDLFRAYMSEEMALYPEVSYDMKPKLFVKNLSKWKYTFVPVAALMLRHKFISGFLAFAKGEYASAVADIKWILLSIGIIEVTVPCYVGKNEFLTTKCKRTAIRLLCRILNLGNIQCGRKSWCKIVASLLQEENTDYPMEYLSGRTFQFFLSCGFAYERLAQLDAIEIAVESQDESVPALRYNKPYVEEMVRKYILAANRVSRDNPKAVVLYDRILWGLLLCGGIHLKVMWFFILVRNYLFIQHDYGAVMVNPCHRYDFFATENILDFYTNGWMFVDEIYTLVSGFSDDDLDEIWNPDRGAAFLMPQMFVLGNTLMAVDGFYSEVNGYTNNKIFFKVSDFHIKPKYKAHIKIPNKIVEEQFRLSRDLVDLWIESYTEKNGSIPPFINDALQSM